MLSVSYRFVPCAHGDERLFRRPYVQSMHDTFHGIVGGLWQRMAKHIDRVTGLWGGWFVAPLQWQGSYTYRQTLQSDSDTMGMSHVQIAFVLSAYADQLEKRHGKKPTTKELVSTFSANTKLAGSSEPLSVTFVVA